MHFGVTGHAAECSDIRGGMIVSTRIKDAVCDAVRSKVRVKSVVYCGSCLMSRFVVAAPLASHLHLIMMLCECASQTGVKPMPAPKGQEPDIQLVAVAYRDTLSLYRNMSGTSLHRRGYVVT